MPCSVAMVPCAAASCACSVAIMAVAFASSAGSTPEDAAEAGAGDAVAVSELLCDEPVDGLAEAADGAQVGHEQEQGGGVCVGLVVRVPDAEPVPDADGATEDELEPVAVALGELEAVVDAVAVRDGVAMAA